ncbi:MAG: PEP-CTERM sorting domain-containing protein [bacterium]
MMDRGAGDEAKDEGREESDGRTRATEGGRMTALGGVGVGRAIAWMSLAVAVMAGGTGAAYASGVDVLLYDDGSGNLRAGAIDKDELLPALNTFVVEGELFGDTSLATPAFQGDEPGFFSVSDANAGVLGGLNTNLPGGAGVSLDFLVEPTLNISLSYWDDGLGQFGATPNGETMTLTKGASFFGTLGGASEVLGAAIGTTGIDGFIDDHPDFDLGTATPGVYLTYGQANVDGLDGPSNPFWLVFGTLDVCEQTESCTALQEAFNAGIEGQIEAGIAYVNTVLVPEPSTALLMSLGLMGLGHSARRSRRGEGAAL